MATSCGGEAPTVVFVTVDARPMVQPASALEVEVGNGGDSERTLFFLDSTAFPMTFTVTAPGRSGDLRIDVAAVQELENDRLVRARGAATATIVPQGRTDVALLLEPHDFVVGTTTAGDQATTFVPDGRNGRQIAAAEDGSFLIAFASGCAPACEARARWFDARANPIRIEGTSSTGDFLAARTGETEPTVATALLGDLAVIVWIGARSSPQGTDVRAAVIARDGGVVADDIILDSGGVADPVADPQAVVLGSGELLIVWRHGEANDALLHGRLLGRDGAPLVNDITGTDGAFDIGPGGPGAGATVAATGEGRGFVAVWSDGGNVLARFFDATGRPHTETPVPLTSYADAVVRGAHVTWDGAAAVVAWDAVSAETTAESTSLETGALLMGRFLPPDGMPDGEHVVLATETADTTSVPDVAVRDDGTAAAVWHDCGAGSDGAGCGIRMRMVDHVGMPLSAPFVAATTTAGDQREPAITASLEAFLVTWTDHSATIPDTSGSAVRARAVYASPGLAPAPALTVEPAWPAAGSVIPFAD